MHNTARTTLISIMGKIFHNFWNSRPPTPPLCAATAMVRYVPIEETV